MRFSWLPLGHRALWLICAGIQACFGAGALIEAWQRANFNIAIMLCLAMVYVRGYFRAKVRGWALARKLLDADLELVQRDAHTHQSLEHISGDIAKLNQRMRAGYYDA